MGYGDSKSEEQKEAMNNLYKYNTREEVIPLYDDYTTFRVWS